MANGDMAMMPEMQVAERFNRLYEEFGAYVKGIISRSVTVPELRADIDDLTQSVWLRIWKHCDSINIEMNRKAYVVTVTKNVIWDAFSKNRRNHTVDLFRGEAQCDDAENLAERLMVSDPESEMEVSERNRVICNAMSSLPEKCEEVLVLHVFGGLKKGQIAEKLGINGSTVTARLKKALKILSKKLNPDIFLEFSNGMPHARTEVACQA